MRRDDIIASLITTLASTSEQIVCAYLFGSVARGEQRPGSDVDVAVLFQTPPPKTLIRPVSRLQAELELAVSKPVDLVSLNGAAPDLVHRVLRDVIEHHLDDLLRFAAEIRARN